MITRFTAIPASDVLTKLTGASDVNIARCAAFLPTVNANADPADVHTAVAAMFSHGTVPELRVGP